MSSLIVDGTNYRIHRFDDPHRIMVSSRNVIGTPKWLVIDDPVRRGRIIEAALLAMKSSRDRLWRALLEQNPGYGTLANNEPSTWRCNLDA